MRLWTLLALGALPVFAHAQPAQIDTALASLYFSEIETAGAGDAGRLWGRRVDGPMFFVGASSGIVVANAPDREGLLSQNGKVWTGRLPQSIVPANTATTLGGRRYSMLMWPVPDNRYSRTRLLMHESFHRIQDSLGLPMANPSNVHMSTLSGRMWTRLEWRALTEALLRDGEARRRALADALAIRARRHLLSARAAEEERQLELNEGLAEYTGLVLNGLPRSALADRVALQLAQHEQQESFVRSFAYATGPAYALLLDASGSQWRQRLSSSTSLPALAAKTYGIVMATADSATLVARYGARRMVAEERSREARRITAEADMRAQFIDGPSLTLPVGSKFSFSFDPTGVKILPGTGAVYESSRITDEWGSLDVTSGGVLMLRDAAGLITGVVVAKPVIAGENLSGDGWKLTLARGWRAQEVAGKAGSYRLAPAD